VEATSTLKSFLNNYFLIVTEKKIYKYGRLTARMTMPAQSAEPPHLIVLTGFPRAGKSEVANHLMRKHKFARLGTDHLRTAIYGADWTPELFRTKRDEFIYGPMMQCGIGYALQTGLDIVVDATSYTRQHRQAYLYPWNEQTPPARKMLLWLATDRDIIEQRQIAAGRDPAQLKHWDDGWEDPLPSSEYQLIKAPNNTPEDLAGIKRMLDDYVRK
jgi:predicted kinase